MYLTDMVCLDALLKLAKVAGATVTVNETCVTTHFSFNCFDCGPNFNTLELNIRQGIAFILDVKPELIPKWIEIIREAENFQKDLNVVKMLG